MTEAERLADAIRALIKKNQDAADLRLVQQTTYSLADLYRKGKARGLLTSRSAYQ